MPVLSNANHETFAMCIAEGMSQADAYRKAYPTSKKWQPMSLYVKASQLAAQDKVKLRIDELKEATASALIMDIRDRKIKLSDIARKSHSEKMAISAIDTLNKMEGTYNHTKTVDATVHGELSETAAKISEILAEEDDITDSVDNSTD